MKNFLRIFTIIAFLDSTTLAAEDEGSFGFNLRENPVLETSQERMMDDEVGMDEQYDSTGDVPINIHDFHINSKNYLLP